MPCGRVQIRSLAGAGWQQDRQRFAAYAQAVLASALAALAHAAAGDESAAAGNESTAASGESAAAGNESAAIKDLAASRMLLQGIVKGVRSSIQHAAFAHAMKDLYVKRRIAWVVSRALS